MPMPIVWDTATSKKVYFARSVDAREALALGQYQLEAPVGAEDAYIAERAADTPIDVMGVTEKARLGGPVSSDDRDKLGEAWLIV